MKNIDELKKKYEELGAEIKRLEKRGCPLKGGQEYWFIDCDGIEHWSIWEDDVADQYRLKKGNVFLSREDAETVLKIEARIDELNDGWEPDWGNFKQEKWSLYYYHAAQEWKNTPSCSCQDGGATYMTEQTAKTILKEFTTEQLNLWGRGGLSNLEN